MCSVHIQPMWIATCCPLWAHVVDSETVKISGFVTATFGQAEDIALKFFEVKNPLGMPYSLLQIDNGAISSAVSVKRCDCAIMNPSDLSFVEFKANATSNNRKAIKKNYKCAMKQLRTTIDLFKNGLAYLGQSLTTLRNVDAYVCFRRGYPRLTTSEMNYIVGFAADTDGIPLSFNPRKTL